MYAVLWSGAIASSCAFIPGAGPAMKLASSLSVDGSKKRTCPPTLSTMMSPAVPVGLVRLALAATAGVAAASDAPSSNPTIRSREPAIRERSAQIARHISVSITNDSQYPRKSGVTAHAAQCAVVRRHRQNALNPRPTPRRNGVRLMCGIVAAFSRHHPISEASVRRAVQSLFHRGPDGQRHWISPDRRVALGHARLSIIDLATGTQPIASEDERSHIVVNGEFYGYEAIQRELERSGHHLRTRSDSEIALHLYQDLGPQCLHRLRGEFAFVIWDDRHRTLFAARDRFGIKPLFYAFHDGTLYLASEIKALFAAGVPARWDAESVAQSVDLGGHQVRTLFDGVFQVPPGHYLLATDKHMQLVRYWDFDYPHVA